MVLQSIRDRLTGIMAIFILGLLIIPFAFVGVNSYFTSDAINAVAVVNDQEISINQYNQAFQNYRRRMQAQLGTNFDPDMFDQPIVRRQFLDQLIDEELMSQVALDAGLDVSDERLGETIRTMAVFDVDGEFNADVYQQRLAAQGLTPGQFENDVRSSLVTNQFPSAIMNSAITTDWEIRDYARLQEQVRDFYAVVVPAFPEEESAEAEAELAEAEVEAAEPVAAEAEVEIEEEAVLAWYEENQSDFMSEEQVVIEYLELDASQLGGAIEPDEEVLRDRFEQQSMRFITPEARLASHILLEVDTEAPQVDVEAARQQAEDLAARARDGEDFAELAREFSQDLGSSEEGGDLGWVEPGYMVQAFEDALYEMSLDNPVSDPIKTGFGWHVINLREIRPSEGMTYAEARDLLLQEYQAEADERRFLEQADRLIDIIYEDPTTLDAAADELGLPVLEAGPFGRGGTDLGLTANMEVVNAAFSDMVLGQGSVSDPIDLGTNHIVLVRLKEHLPEALMPLEEVRDQVVGAVRRDRAMQAALADAEDLLAQLQAGGDIQALSESTGLELIDGREAKRIRADIAPELRLHVFRMDPPGEDGPVLEIAELPDGYAVVQLDNVADGELSEEDAMRLEAYKRRIASSTANTETLGFIRMLRSQSTIEVFEDRL
jgi:peptidyl-prolyl cis-trans isomerase D